MRHALLLSMVASLVLAARGACAEEVKLHFDSLPHQEPIAAEISLSITIEGTDQACNFVRSMHPLMSLEKFHARIEGQHVAAGKQHKVEHDDVRVEVRYDDEDYEYDWKRGEPPAELQSNKLTQMIWFLAMTTRQYELSALGHYKSADPNQDHNGEALDLFSNGITRLKDEAVSEGDTWTEEWKGSRTEKNKKGRWRFKQTAKLEKVEEREGRKVAIVTSELTGTLEGDEDKTADEKWTKCAGKTRVVLDVATGKIREQSGQGKITAYYKNTAEDGGKNEVTITFGVEGKRVSRR